MLYQSNRYFKLWAQTVSHGLLVLRSSEIYPDVEGHDPSEAFNIDIEIMSVVYLDLPTSLKGISIGELKENIPAKFERYVAKKYKVFQVVSQNEVFYVVADSFVVGKNNWHTECIITNFALSYDEVIFSSNN